MVPFTGASGSPLDGAAGDTAVPGAIGTGEIGVPSIVSMDGVGKSVGGALICRGGVGRVEGGGGVDGCGTGCVRICPAANAGRGRIRHKRLVSTALINKIS